MGRRGVEEEGKRVRPTGPSAQCLPTYSIIPVSTFRLTCVRTCDAETENACLVVRTAEEQS